MHRRACSWRTCMPTDRTTPNIARLSRERMCSSILCSTIASQEPSRFLLYAPAFYLTLCSCVSHCASAFRSTLLHFTLLCAPAFQTVFSTVLLRFALFHTVLLRFTLGSCDVRSRFTLQTYVQQYIVLYDRVSRTFSLCSSISHWAPAFRSVLLRFTLCS